MMRLDRPRYSFNQAIDICIDGITGNDVLRDKLCRGKTALTSGEAIYSSLSGVGNLFTIQPIVDRGNQDSIIAEELKRTELIKIYDQYFVPEGKPARCIYDEILNSAKEKCPFCGGIGTPKNLDHFLEHNLLEPLTYLHYHNQYL